MVLTTTLQINKIKGTLILKLAMVKRLQVTNICHQNLSQKFVKKIRHKNLSQDFVTKLFHKDSSQNFTKKIRHKTSLQNFVTKSLSKKFVTKLCHKALSQNFVTKLCHKTLSQNFVTKHQNNKGKRLLFWWSNMCSQKLRLSGKRITSLKRSKNNKFDLHLTAQAVCSEKIVATLFDKFVQCCICNFCAFWWYIFIYSYIPQRIHMQCSIFSSDS